MKFHLKNKYGKATCGTNGSQNGAIVKDRETLEKIGAHSPHIICEKCCISKQGE